MCIRFTQAAQQEGNRVADALAARNKNNAKKNGDPYSETELDSLALELSKAAAHAVSTLTHELFPAFAQTFVFKATTQHNHPGCFLDSLLTVTYHTFLFHFIALTLKLVV
jgi:hypothetical protein